MINNFENTESWEDKAGNTLKAFENTESWEDKADVHIIDN